MIRFECGDVREVLQTVPADSIQCVVTSPPYWNLRDYNLPPLVWGGKSDCQHVWASQPRKGISGGYNEWSKTRHMVRSVVPDNEQAVCTTCNAWRGHLGLEPTIEMYVLHIVEIFREVRRVLRGDGTVWLNIASCYISSRTESEHAIIREDLTDEEYQQVLSSLWPQDASAEPRLSDMLHHAAYPPAKLCDESVREMQPTVHDTLQSDGTWPRALLLANMCSIGKSDSQETEANGSVQDVRQILRKTQVGDSQDTSRSTLLQPDLLVQSQPAGQSLPVDGGSARTNESRRFEVASSRSGAGQVSLPDLPRTSGAGGAPHPAILDASSREMGGVERANALPIVPSQVSVQGDGTLRNPELHRVSVRRRLAITLPRDQIPQEVRQYFRPLWVLKPKDDAMIPARLALALQADGWICRSTIIWNKPNVMPSSVTDRPTTAHEYVFLLTKNSQYFYDSVASAEPAIHAGRVVKKYPADAKTLQLGKRTYSGFGDHDTPVKATRNRRSVWSINSQPYKGAHFATFPEKLVEPCILAGTSEGCCSVCFAPLLRQTELTAEYKVVKERLRERLGPDYHMKRAGFGWENTCSHGAETIPCMVLDPFMGSGTTLLVARNHGRSAIGIDLNPDYVKLAQQRLGI